MKVTVVGTSCTWFLRKNTSFIIDDKIVLDVPNGAYKDVVANTSIEKISTVLISHFHSDHFEDFRILATIIMRERPENLEKVRVFAPKGCLKRVVRQNKLSDGFGDELDQKSYMKNIEFITLSDGFEFEIENYKVTALKMQHGVAETYGFVFKDKISGKVVAFSADTEMCENVHKLLINSDAAFVELASNKKRKNHLCIEEFENLLKTYKTTKIYPVHTCDRCQKYVEDNNLNPLHDGQVVDV